jgi:isopentenyl diphosphate isomerase/L-lactate dehydrogenase-like FMN-dependent dehydrogenase
MLKVLTDAQFWSLLRTLIQSTGASLAVLGVVHPETVEQLLGLTSQTQILVGAAANVGTTIYSLVIRTKAGLIASAAALPEVAKIVTTPTLAAKVDDPAVVSRG